MEQARAGINKPFISRSGESVISADGCGPRNLGGTLQGGIGAVLHGPDGHPVEILNERHISPSMTNNMAEFLAIELALKMAIANDEPGRKWVIFTDSKYTLSCWINNDFVKKPHLIKIKRRWNELADKLQWRVTLRWIAAEENIYADAASRAAINNEQSIEHF